MIPRMLMLLSSVWMLSANAEVYRWVDEQGNVHFGDKPPVAKQAEEVRIRKTPTPVPGADPSSRLEQQRRLLNAYREERLKKEQEQREAEEERVKRVRACAQARDDLRQYERSSGIYDYDSQGNKVYMNTVEREAFIEDLRAQIRQHCD